MIKKNCILNTCWLHADHHSRCGVLRLLDMTLDCSKNVVIHPLLVALRLCVPGIHQEWICVCTTGRSSQLATCCSAAGCVRTTVIVEIEVVRAIGSVRFRL